MKPSVYIETTIISYLTAKPSRDLIIAAHHQITTEWWTEVRPQADCCVSAFVIDEASRGDVTAALQIPEKARIDAFHLAIAAWHKMDYVLSWNCKHIASGRVQKALRETNARLGVHTPVVCTPEELMEV